MTTRRTELKAAIAARNAKLEVHREAEQAEQRGRELLRSTEADLAKFADVDGTILKHRAGKIKAAAKGGPTPDLKLPGALVQRKVARDEAREHVDAAKAAHDSLVTDLGAAKRQLKQAESQVTSAANAILVEEGIQRAAALSRAWDEVWRVYDELQALAGSWLPGPVTPVRVERCEWPPHLG
jgi:hypothetical protein